MSKGAWARSAAGHYQLGGDTWQNRFVECNAEHFEAIYGPQWTSEHRGGGKHPRSIYRCL